MRTLESEVKELKDLLDEKDEKMDILSRVRSSSIMQERPSVTESIKTVIEAKPTVENEKPAPREDIFRIQQSPCLVQGDRQGPFFMGAASGRPFVGKR